MSLIEQSELIKGSIYLANMGIVVGVGGLLGVAAYAITSILKINKKCRIEE